LPKLKLTDAAVQRLKAPAGARIDYFDASLGGFGLRVSGPPPTHPGNPCRKSWFLFYRYRGEQKRLTLEPVYPALTLGEARKRAHDALCELAEDTDPAARKADEQKRADAIEAVIGKYLARRPKPGKKPLSPRYLAETKRNFDNHVIPRWRGRMIKEITRRDINDLIDAVMENGTDVREDNGKKRHVPGGPIAANRVLSAISGLFNWCVARGIMEATPAARVEKPAGENVGGRALDANNNAGEIGSLWPEFEALGYPFGHFFSLALLTGQRRDEVAALRWDEIDEAKLIWTLPATRTKSGRAHIVPLSPLAMSILKRARADRLTLFATCADEKKKIGPYVFTTTFSSPISGYSRAKLRLDRAVNAVRKSQGLNELPPWRIHDLRRTVATHLAALNVDKSVIARILNHAPSGVTNKHYIVFEYLPEKRHALEAWGRRIEESATPRPAKVTNPHTRDDNGVGRARDAIHT
jgi:integrase